MKHPKPIRVLFVCMGNICRSPMAEAVFRRLVEEAGLADCFEIQSAGTGSWHIGERPHPGTVQILERNGISVGHKRAQQLRQSDGNAYHYIIAMDQENVEDIQGIVGLRVSRLLDYAPASTERDVPDPYYSHGFSTVYDLVLAGAKGLLANIRLQEDL